MVQLQPQLLTAKDFVEHYGDNPQYELINGELVTAFKQVIAAAEPIQIGSTAAFKLTSMGLVKYHGNEVQPLGNLYRYYFQTHLAPAGAN
jgi:hypothetical protein